MKILKSYIKKVKARRGNADGFKEVEVEFPMLDVEHEGAVYDVKIPAYCTDEESVLEYVKNYVATKKLEAPAEKSKFKLSSLVNKEV